MTREGEGAQRHFEDRDSAHEDGAHDEFPTVASNTAR
jgi:hypothetical protein